jgi:hypothetical protein
MSIKNLSTKKFRAVIFIAIFISSFLCSYFVISLIPLAYYHERADSQPTLGGSISLIGVFGPAPNSTDVPLDTAIVVFFMRPVNITDLYLVPEVPIKSQSIEQSHPASVEYTFSFAEPLESATTYNVSLLAGGKPLTWNFTTTAEPYQPRFNTYLYPSVPLVAFAIAITMSFSVSLMVRHKKRKTLGASQIC